MTVLERKLHSYLEATVESFNNSQLGSELAPAQCDINLYLTSCLALEGPLDVRGTSSGTEVRWKSEHPRWSEMSTGL